MRGSASCGRVNTTAIGWIWVMRDDAQRRGVGGADEIARVDLAQADAPVDRRGDGAEIEVELGGGDGGVVAHQGGA